MSVSFEKKGIEFSVRIAELVKYLREDGKEFQLSDRLLSCGVTVGLLMRSGKYNEAAKLITEADYIIEMAIVAGYLTSKQGVHIRADCENLLKQIKIKSEENYYEQDN